MRPNLAFKRGTTSARFPQADHPGTTYQMVWNPRQHLPTPRHASSLLRHLLRYTWRAGRAVASSELDGDTVGCYVAARAVKTYDFGTRLDAASRAVGRLQRLLLHPRPDGMAKAVTAAATAAELEATSAVVFNRASGRRMLNEVQACRALRLAGFRQVQVVDPSALHLSALAQLLQSSALLVGIHGAALVHTIWLRRDRSALIEAFLPDHAYGLYQQIARVAAVAHYALYLRCAGTVSGVGMSVGRAYWASAWD